MKSQEFDNGQEGGVRAYQGARGEVSGRLFKPNEWSKVNPKRRPRRKKTNGSPANDGTNDTPAMKTKPFLGRCDKLEGFIYNIGTNQADKYIKTTRNIVDYVGRTFTAESKN